MYTYIIRYCRYEIVIFLCVSIVNDSWWHDEIPISSSLYSRMSCHQESSILHTCILTNFTYTLSKFNCDTPFLFFYNIIQKHLLLSHCAFTRTNKQSYLPKPIKILYTYTFSLLHNTRTVPPLLRRQKATPHARAYIIIITYARETTLAHSHKVCIRAALRGEVVELAVELIRAVLDIHSSRSR